MHPVQGGLERTALRPDRGTRPARTTSPPSREYAEAHPDLPWVLGGGWAMPAFPGGTPTAAALDAVVPDRPVFLPNRDHHGAWVNSPRAAAGRHRRATPPTRPTAASSATPTGTRPARCTRARWRLVARLLPGHHRRRATAALLAGQAYLHSLRRHRLAGRDHRRVRRHRRPGPAYLRAAAARRPDRPGRRRALVGPHRGLEQIDDAGRAARGGTAAAGSAATTVKIMQDGVAENFTAAMLEPYLDGHGHPPQLGHLVRRRPSCCARRSPALDAEGFQVHFHAHRRPRRARGAGRRRRRPTATARDRRHHIAHIQVVHPDDVRASPRSAWPPTCSRCGPCLDDADGRADPAVPRRGARRLAVPVRRSAPRRGPARRPAATGRSPPRTRSPRSTSRSTASAPGYEEGRHEPFLPEQALDLGDRPHRLHGRLGLGEPPRRHRRRAGCSPTSPCSTATRSPGRATRSARRGCVATYVDGEVVFGRLADVLAGRPRARRPGWPLEVAGRARRSADRAARARGSASLVDDVDREPASGCVS